MKVSSTFTLPLGAKAPDFSLPDAHGQWHSLADIRGASGTLVVFACNHCPFVIHLATQLGAVADQLGRCGIATVVINSNDLAAFPQDGPEPMKEFAAQRGWDFPYLIDSSQQVAKAYGAACTPDFFLFDANLALYYTGQFDESRPNNGSVATGTVLSMAADHMLANMPPDPSPVPSTGCNIKWIPGQEPQWFLK
jgi:peroxiredoxin